MQATATTPTEKAAIDAELRYRRARFISNVGFVAGGLILFFSLWYIVGKGTPLDMSLVLGSMFGTHRGNGTAKQPAYLAGLELDPIDPKKLPPVFLSAPPPPPTPVPARPHGTSSGAGSRVGQREQRLRKALEEANRQFRAWQFPQAEKSYMAVVKVLSGTRAIKLQREVCTMFFKRGVRFYKEKRYTKALEVLRIALHFDPRNRLAHQYLARCYRLLGQGNKAKYHERMVAKLKKKGL